MHFNNLSFSNRIIAPHSKSYAIRAIIAASLSDKPVEIIFNGICEDTLTALRCSAALGASYELTEKGAIIYPSTVFACHCDFGECAAALRLIYPAALYLNPDFTFTASRRLNERIAGTLPLRSEMLKSDYICDVSKSSQLFSGMLFLKALTGGEIKLDANAVSKPYIEMTLKVLYDFGAEFKNENGVLTFTNKDRFHSPESYTVEGDWSSSAFLLVAGAIGSHSVEVCGLNQKSIQGDRRITGILESAAVKLILNNDNLCACPSAIKGIDTDVTDIPDLVPPLAALACASEDTSVFRNASRLRLKESDRISGICDSLNACGAYAVFENENLIIRGPVKKGSLPFINDHRIAMMQILLCLIADCDINPDVLKTFGKSYPDFINTFGADNV